MRLLLVLGVLLLAQGKEKASLDLQVRPKIGMVGMTPQEVTVMAKLKDPGHIFCCPMEVWEWGDGYRTSHQRDCSPHEEREKHESDRFYSYVRYYRHPGEYTITHALVGENKKVLKASTTLIIKGF